MRLRARVVLARMTTLPASESYRLLELVSIARTQRKMLTSDDKPQKTQSFRTKRFLRLILREAIYMSGTRLLEWLPSFEVNLALARDA